MRRLAALAGFALGSLPSAAAGQPYEPPTTPPVDIDASGAAAPVKKAPMDDRTRRNFLIAGVIVFAVSYATPVLVGAPFEYANQGGWLWLPVAGPVVTAVSREACVDCRPGEAALGPALFVSSIGQATGIGLLTAALLYRSGPEPLEISPTFDTSGVGLRLRGGW